MLVYYLTFSYPDGHSEEDIVIEYGYEAKPKGIKPQVLY